MILKKQYIAYRIFLRYLPEDYSEWLVSILEYVYEKFFLDHDDGYLIINPYQGSDETVLNKDIMSDFLNAVKSGEVFSFCMFRRVRDASPEDKFPIVFRIDDDDYSKICSNAADYSKNKNSQIKEMRFVKNASVNHVNIVVSTATYNDHKLWHSGLTDFYKSLASVIPVDYGYISLEDPSIVFRFRSYEELRFKMVRQCATNYNNRGMRIFNVAGVFWGNFLTDNHMNSINQNNLTLLKNTHRVVELSENVTYIESNEDIFADTVKDYTKLKEILSPLIPDMINPHWTLLKDSIKGYLIKNSSIEILGGLEYIKQYAPADEIIELENGDVLFILKQTSNSEGEYFSTFLWPITPFRLKPIMHQSDFGPSYIYLVYKRGDKVKGENFCSKNAINNQIVNFVLALVRGKSAKKMVEIEQWIKKWAAMTTETEDLDLNLIREDKYFIIWNIESRYLSEEKIIYLYRGLEDVLADSNSFFVLLTDPLTDSLKEYLGKFSGDGLMVGP